MDTKITVSNRVNTTGWHPGLLNETHWWKTTIVWEQTYKSTFMHTTIYESQFIKKHHIIAFVRHFHCSPNNMYCWLEMNIIQTSSPQNMTDRMTIARTMQEIWNVI